jgi:hypothetical protein
MYERLRRQGRAGDRGHDQRSQILFLAFNMFVELVSPKGWSMSCVSSMVPQRRHSEAEPQRKAAYSER